MSKRQGLALAFVALVFAVGVRVGVGLGASSPSTSAEGSSPPVRASRGLLPSPVGLDEPLGAPSAARDEAEARRVAFAVDAGVVVDEAPSSPEALRTAESIVGAALVHRTLTPADRARLTALLPAIARSDRARLEASIFGALGSGELELSSDAP